MKFWYKIIKRGVLITLYSWSHYTKSQYACVYVRSIDGRDHRCINACVLYYSTHHLIKSAFICFLEFLTPNKKSIVFCFFFFCFFFIHCVFFQMYTSEFVCAMACLVCLSILCIYIYIGSLLLPNILFSSYVPFCVCCSTRKTSIIWFRCRHEIYIICFGDISLFLMCALCLWNFWIRRLLYLIILPLLMTTSALRRLNFLFFFARALREYKGNNKYQKKEKKKEIHV